jgi:hypothetical protein
MIKYIANLSEISLETVALLFPISASKHYTHTHTHTHLFNLPPNLQGF